VNKWRERRELRAAQKRSVEATRRLALALAEVQATVGTRVAEAFEALATSLKTQREFDRVIKEAEKP
jgi:hypothetical protein